MVRWARGMFVSHACESCSSVISCLTSLRGVAFVAVLINVNFVCDALHIQTFIVSLSWMECTVLYIGLHLTKHKSIVLYSDGVREKRHHPILRVVFTYLLVTELPSRVQDTGAIVKIFEAAVLSTHAFHWCSRLMKEVRLIKNGYHAGVYVYLNLQRGLPRLGAYHLRFCFTLYCAVLYCACNTILTMAKHRVTAAWFSIITSRSPHRAGCLVLQLKTTAKQYSVRDVFHS